MVSPTAGRRRDQDVYRRWVDLAAEVLEARVGGPADAVRRALLQDLRARVAAILLVDGARTALLPVGAPCPTALDLAFYARHATADPAVRRSLATTGDTHVRRTAAGAGSGDAARRLADRLRRDGIEHVLLLPQPAQAGERRWLVVARAEPFTADDVDVAERVHRLAAGLERLATARAPRRADPSGEAVGSPAAGPVERPAGLGGAADAPSPPVLTDRELAVLGLMAEGLIARAIGHRLGVSPRTVAKHQERIYRKLRTQDRLTTVLHARAAGLVRG